LRRTWFAGYRVADADALLERFAGRVSELWVQVEELKTQLAESEARRVETEQQLAAAVQRELELVERVEAMDAARERVLDDARLQARRIVDAANLEAVRIKGDAQAQADVARGQVDELLRLRETLSSTMRAVVRDFEATMGRIDRGDAALSAPPLPIAPMEVPAEWVNGSARNGENGAAADGDENGSTPDIFDGRVEVEAGPFNDFTALSAFERALGSLPKIEDVYIRRFAGDRATIDLTLVEPASLIDVMTDRMPYHLNVERSGLDQIAVTVSDLG
jgi:hypothetical protein